MWALLWVKKRPKYKNKYIFLRAAVFLSAVRAYQPFYVKIKFIISCLHLFLN